MKKNRVIALPVRSFQKERLRLNALAVLVASAALPAFAADTVPGIEKSAWLSARVEAPESARAPILITLLPAEGPCRKVHGDDWWMNCSVSPGRPGAVATGVRLSPAVEGTWRWRDETTLAFEPAEAWKPRQLLTASLLGIPLPLRAGIEKTVLTIETPPLAARSNRGEAWIDPKVDGGRWVSFEYRFTTAPDRAKVEAAFRIETKKGSLIRTARPEFLWTDDGTGVYVKARLLALPEAREVITARIAGIAARIDQADCRFTVPKGFETVRTRLTVPGMTDLFAVTEASVEAVRDEGLNVEYELSLGTTLEADPENVLRNLRLLTLPKRLNDDAQSDADWTQAPVIDDEVLSRAEPVEATVAPDAAGRSNRTRLRFTAPAGSFLYLELPEGFGPEKVPGLSEAWSTVLPVPHPSCSLEFLQPGSMLTLSGSRSLSIVSTGVERIRWRIARVRNDFLALAADGWNVLKNPSPDAWTSATTGELKLSDGAEEASGRARFSSLDLGEAVGDAGPGLFQIELEGVRSVGKDGRTEDEVVARAERRLLVTNIALIAKTSADDSIDVFAAGFQDERPAPHLRASLLAANGTVIESADTDGDGHVRFASVRGLERERRPVAVVVRSAGTDLAWLSLADASNVSPTLRWDAGGRETRGSNLAALVFADRGVLQAGETAHFGVAARCTDWSLLPEGLTLTARLTDDAGGVLFSAPMKLTHEGLGTLDWLVPAGTPPGRIRLDLLAADGRTSLATTDVLVAETAPETLALSVKAPWPAAAEGWSRPEDERLPARLTSLFGAGAEGRTVSGELRVTTLSEAGFPQWPGFTFPSGGRTGRERRIPLERAATSGTGEAVLDLPLSGLAPELAGFARASLVLEGSEPDGGDSVERRLDFLLHPGDLALGWRLADTPQPAAFLPTGRPATLEIAAVDGRLAPKPDVRLRARIERTHRVASVVEDASGRLGTTESVMAEAVRTLDVRTDGNGRALVALDTSLPGDWQVVVTAGSEGRPLLTVPYSTVGGTLPEVHRLAAGDLPAAELRARLEKTRLEAGDTARISLLSPTGGFALVTLESSGVISSKWLPVRAGENLLEIPVPEGFSGRAWVRVAVIRGQSSANAFMRGFAEWAAPVSLNTAGKRLSLSLSVPTETRTDDRTDKDAPPQEDGFVEVPVTLRADEPARVILWAVDEGLLALTDHPVPDPVGSLLEDRALEVTTRETLSELMPDAGAVAALASPFGGDAEMSAGLAGAFGAASPFTRSPGRPALWWGGLVEAGPEERTFRARVPEGFSGRLKFFAVGASDDRAGAATASGIIREPLVIRAALPAVLAPGDRFRAGFTLTPEDGAGLTAGALDVRPPAGFLPDAVTIPVVFPETGGAIVPADFTVPADGKPGEAGIDLHAVAGGLSARRRVPLVVRPACVKETILSGGRLERSDADAEKDGGQGRILRLETELTPFRSSTRFTVSLRPEGLLAAFGESFARDEAPSARSAASAGWSSPADAIAAALPLTLAVSRSDAKTDDADVERLRRRQACAVRTIEGSLGRNGVKALPWLEPDLYLTAWSLEYLLVARTSPLGAEVPPELLRGVRDRLVRMLPGDPQSLDEARSAAYALWVLTREGTMTTEWLESLRAALEERFPEWRKDATAAFMAAAYQQLRLRDEASDLLSGTLSTARAGGAWSPERATALSAAALSRAGLGAHPVARFLAAMTAEDFARALDQGASAPLSALHAGAVALAMGETPVPAGDAAGEENPLKTALLVCRRRAPGFEGGSDRLERSADALHLVAPGCVEVAARGLSDTAFWWEAEQSGWPRTAEGTTKPVRNGLEAERVFLDASGRPATTFRAGERVTVRVRLRSSSGDVPLRDVVVTDLLPGGMRYATPVGTGPEGAGRFLRKEAQMSWLSPELSSWGSTEFTYVVRAATPGEYAVAPVAAGSLSHPTIRARSASSRLTILGEGELPLKSPEKAESPSTTASAINPIQTGN